jgi:hemolysin activation/secretion protein
MVDNAPATSLPSAADVGRVNGKNIVLPEKLDIPSSIEGEGITTHFAPANAKSIKFLLKEIVVEGATIFSHDQFDDLYQQYLDTTVSLDQIYAIANRITEIYRQQGYSLSVANVPNQTIANGRVIIKVLEGFVAHVAINDKIAKDAIIKSYIKRLVAQKPVTSEALESFLLRINDLGGIIFVEYCLALREQKKVAWS